MRNKLLFLLVIFLLSMSYTAIAQQQKKIDNYSFMKLYVTNSDNEVLLIGGDDWWEITGSRYNQALSVHEFVDWMAERMGITVKNIRLRGMFTFFYDWREVKNPTLMHYYSAEYDSGELLVPDGCKYIKWVKKSEINSLIPYNEMKMILHKIDESDYLLGGSFLIEKDENNKRVGKLIELFYRLY